MAPPCDFVRYDGFSRSGRWYAEGEAGRRSLRVLDEDLPSCRPFVQGQACSANHAECKGPFSSRAIVTHVSSEYRQTLEDIRAAKRGDPAPLFCVLDRYQERLLARIRWMLGPRARRVAESGDFLHEVFVEIADGLDGFEPRDEKSFLRWATAIARNNIRSHASEKRMRSFESFASATIEHTLPEKSAVEPLALLAIAESAALLLEGLESLSPDHRRVIELRHFEGRSFSAISKELGRSENAAQLLHARALLSLGGTLSASGRRN